MAKVILIFFGAWFAYVLMASPSSAGVVTSGVVCCGGGTIDSGGVSVTIDVTITPDSPYIDLVFGSSLSFDSGDSSQQQQTFTLPCCTYPSSWNEDVTFVYTHGGVFVPSISWSYGEATYANNILYVSGSLVFDSNPVVTPLPAGLPLFASGLGALGLLGWRRKRKNTAAIAPA
jgi:hypothetical protein